LDFRYVATLWIRTVEAYPWSQINQTGQFSCFDCQAPICHSHMPTRSYGIALATEYGKVSLVVLWLASIHSGASF
jgi:hypothetical protein